MSELNYNEKVDKYCSHFVVNTNGYHQQYSLGTLFLMKEILKSILKLVLLMGQDVAQLKNHS